MNFEIDFLKLLRNATTNMLDALFEIITFFGEQYVLILVVAVLYFMYDKKKAEKLIFSVFISLLLNGLMKLLIQRPRPFVKDNEIIPARKETATGYSFPSGHTQNAAVIYTGTALCLKRKKIWVIALCLIFLVGISRLWLGVHYPTDVLAGAALGMLCAFYGLYLIEKFGTTFKKQLILYLAIAVITLPFIIFFYIKMKTVNDGYILYKDFFVSYGLLLGFIGAIVIEHKLVQFEDAPLLKLKVLRCIGFIICVGSLYATLSLTFKLINPTSVILDALRYALVAFFGFGIYPLVFKNTLFKKEQKNHDFS